jgi:hypothetical protein
MKGRQYMWHKLLRSMTALVAVVILAVPLIQAQDSDQTNRDRNDDRDNAPVRNYTNSDNYVRIDRYLDAEIWTNHNDNEFYEGDNVVLNYRVSKDAFVAIYSIDSRGRVRLLFPTDPNQDNYVRGGETYRLPSGDDNFDLVVNGPAGDENIQLVASRERFPIPNWYNNSGLVADADSRDDYMDYLNNTYFVKYGGQKFSYDRLGITVQEWEEDYFHPVYHPVYPSWAVCGNMYIDYPYGSSIYINGEYWGCTPLYVPWILCGWHTITVYDPWGYCWENDVHVSRYNTVVLNRTVIRTASGVASKFKDVRMVGYRDPVKNGYPNFATVVAKDKSTYGGKGTGPVTITKGGTTSTSDNSFTDNLPKKYNRGETRLTKTDRGLETDAISTRTTTASGYSKRTGGTGVVSDQKVTPPSYEAYRKRMGVQGSGTKSTTSSTGNSTSGDFYQRKTGSSDRSQGTSTGTTTTRERRSEPTTGSTSSGKSEPAQVNQGHKSTDGGNSGAKTGTTQPQPRSGGDSNKGTRTQSGGSKHGR